MSDKQTPVPASVLELLNEEQLARLRAGYERESFHAMVTRSLDDPFPPVADWTAFIMGRLYVPETIAPTERELIVIALLAGQGKVGPLAVHFYWGLMEGLTVHQVATAVVLAGTYMGAPNYVQGIRLLHKTLALLADAAASEESARWPAVVKQLVAMFPA